MSHWGTGQEKRYPSLLQRLPAAFKIEILMPQPNTSGIQHNDCNEDKIWAFFICCSVSLINYKMLLFLWILSLKISLTWAWNLISPFYSKVWIPWRWMLFLWNKASQVEHSRQKHFIERVALGTSLFLYSNMFLFLVPVTLLILYQSQRTARTSHPYNWLLFNPLKERSLIFKLY